MADDDYYAGGGEEAERAAVGTAKERKTFLLPIPGDEEFQFFQLGFFWVQPPPLWAMESPVAVRAHTGLEALVAHCERHGEGYKSVRWFLRRVADRDGRFKPARRSLEKIPADIQAHVLSVCAIREHWIVCPARDLKPDLAYRLLDVAALVRRERKTRHALEVA